MCDYIIEMYDLYESAFYLFNFLLFYITRLQIILLY